MRTAVRALAFAALLLAGCEDAPPPGSAAPPGFAIGASTGPGYMTPGGVWLPGSPPPEGVVPGATSPPIDPVTGLPLPAGSTPRPGGASPTPVPEVSGVPAGAETQPGWPQPSEAFELKVPSPPPAATFVPPAFPRNLLPAGAGAIRGRVIDPLHGDAPVAGAWVVAVAAADFSKTAALKTGADGTYAFANLAPAAYFVQASRDGYRGTATPRYLTLSPGLPVLAGATFVLVGR